MRVLIASNLDFTHPFGQHLRPYHLGRALASLGVHVISVGVDASGLDYGTGWSVGRRSLGRLARGVGAAIARDRPDVVYGHEVRGGSAAVLAARGLPVVSDFHSVPSAEWFNYARDAPAAVACGYRASGVRTYLGESVVTRRSAAVIAAGDEVAAELRARHRVRTEVAAVPNGVSDELLDAPSAERPPFGDDGAPGCRHAVAVIPGGSDSNSRALDFVASVGRVVSEAAWPLRLHVLGSREGPGMADVRYHGFQETLLPWLEHADAVMLPYPARAALCGGARNKLLEALARGRRVVTTEEGLRGFREAAAWSGVTVAADDAASFAAALLAATDDGAPTLERSRDAVRDRLRWQSRGPQVLEILERAVARSREHATRGSAAGRR